MSDYVSTSLGRVGFALPVPYFETIEYQVRDIVQFQGNAFVVLRDGVKGVIPSDDGIHYRLLVARGEPGIGNANWFAGTAVTGAGVGIIAVVPGSAAGDMFLNSDNGNVYQAQDADVWDYVTNVIGPPASADMVPARAPDGGSSNVQAELDAAQERLDAGAARVKELTNSNILLNGGMSFWQRGTSITATQGKYGPDQWAALLGTSQADRIVATTSDPFPEGAQYAMRVTCAAGRRDLWGQPLETGHLAYLSGKPVVLTAWVRGNGVTRLICGAGNYLEQSIVATLTAQWQKIRVVIPAFTYDASALRLCCGAVFYKDDTAEIGTYDVVNVKLEEGTEASPFIRQNPSLELLALQRYYWYTARFVAHKYYSTWYSGIPFPTTMRATPTCTVTGQLVGASSSIEATSVSANTTGIQQVQFSSTDVNTTIYTQPLYVAATADASLY